MQNFMKTIINAVQSWTKKEIKNSTADWSQNDSSADNYVKNRTHWEETNEVVLVPEMEIVLDSDPLLNAFDIEFIEGKTYTVVWDGVTYNCIAYIAEGPNAPSIGNGAIANASGGNEEPFFCTAFEGNVMLFGSEGTHTVQILLSETITHKLDPKYIPDDISVQADWNQTDPNAKDYIKNRPFGYSSYTTLIDENITIVDGRASFQSRLDWPISGEKFILTFDGIEYTGTVWEDGDACYRTDFTTSDGIDVVIYDVNYIITSSELDGDHTIKIVVERDGYNKISIHDIPDSIQRTEDAVGRKSSGTGAEEFNVTEDNPSYNRASGDYSTARGYNTLARGNYSTVSGKYNLEDFLYEDIIDTNKTTLVTRNTYYVYYSRVEPQLNVATGLYDISNFSRVSGSFLVGEYPIYIVDSNSISNPKTANHYFFKSDNSYSSQSYRDYVRYEFKNLVYHKPKSYDAHKYAHIVGNGSGYSNKERSNAYTLDWNGVGWYQGGLQVGGNAQDDGAKNVMLEGNAYDYFILNDVNTGTPYKIQIIDGNLVSSAITGETESTT